MNPTGDFRTDFLVIGSGLAGLSFARKAAKLGHVTIVTKDKANMGNTSLAQGGMAAVLKGRRDRESHVEDTLKAGAGLCRRDIVEKVVRASRPAAQEMIDLGVPFDRDPDDPDNLYFTREGGHSERRVLHVADTTGESIARVGLESVRDTENIDILEAHIAIDLLTQHNIPDYQMPQDEDIVCYGAYVYDEGSRSVKKILAKVTVLATGGAGQIYLHTTNPDVATGDGVAMGYRAGARVANMEFIQFHPTTLYEPSSRGSRFLISEAVRGEGGLLRLKDGTRFMSEYAPEAMELAPRDIVARAIDNVLKRTGEPCVYLDISLKGADYIKNRFPNIYNTCLEKGIDITKEWIPVVPAAHYVCGGILTDEHGRTDIKRLYAIGEVAYTGLHGANRLASNSLLEAAVFAHFAYKHIQDEWPLKMDFPDLPDWDVEGTFDQEEWVIIHHNMEYIQRLMWDYVGIVRSDLRLTRALVQVSNIFDEVIDFYRKNPVKRNVLELRNLVYVSWLVVRSALSRTESRGLHYNTDHPEILPGHPVDTIFRSSRFMEDSHV